MKLDELKKIIKEELKSILEANAPEKEEKKTKEEEKITTKPTPRRKVGREDIPKQSPIPIKNETSLKETEIDKITKRFTSYKKINEKSEDGGKVSINVIREKLANALTLKEWDLVKEVYNDLKLY